MSAARPLNIVLLGGFGFDNLGDDLILRAALAQIRKRIPSARFTILSSNPYETARRHPRYPVYFSIEALVRQVILRLVTPFLLSLRAHTLPLRRNDFRETLNAIRRADMIVSLGGGYLNDYSRYLTYFRFAEFILFGLLRKPLVLLAHEIGPLRRLFLRLVAKLALKFVTYATLRDRRSIRVLTSLGFAMRYLRHTADLSWAYEPPMKSRNHSTKEAGIVVALSLLPFHVISGAVGSMVTMAKTAEKIDQQLLSGIASWLVDPALKVRRVAFLSMSSADARLAGHLLQSLAGKIPVDIVTDLESQYEAVTGSHVLVAMRLHPIVMCAQLGVPSIALWPSSKIEDTLTDLALEDSKVQGFPLDTSKLSTLVHQMLVEGPRGKTHVIRAMPERVAELKLRAERNAIIVEAIATTILGKQGLQTICVSHFHPRNT